MRRKCSGSLVSPRASASGRSAADAILCLLVRRFAQDVVAPKVREMDEAETMDPEIIKGLFEQGVCAPPSSPDMSLS